MTGTLFLSDTLTAFVDADGGDAQVAETLFSRKGRLRPEAIDVLQDLSISGPVVVSLPGSWTACQTLNVSVGVGRQVAHADLSKALEAALTKAGGEGMAVVCAEPTDIKIDGTKIDSSPVGVSARQLDISVTAFVSSLKPLSDLENLIGRAGGELNGAMAMEEAISASLIGPAAHNNADMIICDRWHTKIARRVSDMPGASALIPIGEAHIASDLAVTFSLDEEAAEALAHNILLERTSQDQEEMARVAEARLEELATKVAEAAENLGRKSAEFVLLGLRAAPKVTAEFSKAGLNVRSPRGEFRRTEPPLLALIDGAQKLASGTVPRSAVTALQLSAPKKEGGVWSWLKRNF